MRSLNLRDVARSVRLLRKVAAAMVCPLILGFAIGCGPSRPDPLAVVKDGGKDEDEKPRPRAAVQAAAGPRQAPAKNGPQEGAVPGGQPADGPIAAAPFDLSFLPVDTELVLVAQCGEIVRSSLVQTVTAGRLTALDPLVEGFGPRFIDIVSLRIGIRNLHDVPAPTRAALANGLGGLSLREIALNPNISSTIVIQTRDRVDETPLRKLGDEVRVGDTRYFRLKSNTFQSACACIQGFRTLIISDEPTILSIVEASGPPPKPKASFGFARAADLVIAVAPETQRQMQHWLPPVDLFAPPPSDQDPNAAKAQPEESAAAVNVTEDAATADVAATTGEAADEASTETAIPDNVTGAAMMVNLKEGVSISISLNCDSPESAAKVEQELREFTAQAQSSATTASALTGGLSQLVDSLSTTRLHTIAALTMAVTGEGQTDLTTLPALVLGQATPDASIAASTASVAAEPPDAFAGQILVEGLPPLASESALPGMELRGLARWQPAPPGSDGPRQLELGVVAFGGPATTAVAVGHFQLHEAEVNRLSPLKWVGTSPGYDVLGLNPIDGLVPVSRESSSSVHPKNGVLAVFTVVPPSEPATHLRRFRGQFVMRYYTISDEIVVTNLREAIRTKQLPQELRQAEVEVDLGRLAAQETLEVLCVDSTNIGAVRLLRADGTPIEEVTSASTRSQGRVLHTLSTGGTLPDAVGLSITLNSELAEVEVPFEFANLPIPNVGTLSDQQRALLVWTTAEADSGLPEGLVVEAQARWDNPAAASGLLASASQSQSLDRPARRYVLSDSNGEDDRPQHPRQGRAGYQSEQPLRVLVDLTGPLVEEVEAVGEAHVTSIETDFRSELNFEGAYVHREDATGAAVSLDRSSGSAGNGPPGGMRIAFHFTPPLEPIHELGRFNGSVRLQVSRDRTEALFPNLRERVGRKLTNRELTKLGLTLVARIDENQVLVRVLEGADEQISAVIAVDTYGDPVPGVTVSREEAGPKTGGRRVHRLAFANGVPTGIGLRVVANSSVQTVDVPFRFTRLPVPPAPRLPGL